MDDHTGLSCCGLGGYLGPQRHWHYDHTQETMWFFFDLPAVLPGRLVVDLMRSTSTTLHHVHVPQ